MLFCLSDTFSQTSPTNSNRTDPLFCSCSSRTELLRAFTCSVRQLSNNSFVLFGLEQNKQNKLEPALFGKPSLVKSVIHPRIFEHLTNRRCRESEVII